MRRKPGQREKQLRAIIWIQEEDQDRTEAECLAYCERHNYLVESLIIGGAERWHDVWTMLTTGVADVCVVHSKDRVRDRLPRLETVTEEFSAVPSRRRTGRVPRWPF
jgi:hypothetical protein